MKLLSKVENLSVAFADAQPTGYIVECGVARGNSLKRLVRSAKPNQRVFGFDSFEGLPEDWKMSDEHTWPKGSFACDVPDVPGAEIRVGLLADTLPVWKKEHPGRISLLHIDVDLYSATLTTLEELNDQIVPGTVIISDDHFEKFNYQYWYEGQYKAFEEWQEKYSRKTYLLARGEMGQATFRVIK